MEQINNKDNCIHLICGQGKGKTSAAVGMAVRAAGAGFSVCFCQFMKGTESSEIAVLSDIPSIEVMRPTEAYPFFRKMSEEQKRSIASEHSRILDEIEAWLNKNAPKGYGSAVGTNADGDSIQDGSQSKEDEMPKRSLLILDELTHAWNHEIVDRDRILRMLDERLVEIVITGRDPAREFVERADYISRIEKVRHPYDRGLAARKGIEF